MSRAVPEWIGKDDNTPVPPHVRLRVFRDHGGICHRSKRKIRPGEAWQCDHVIALIEKGQNRESNLAPILSEPHKIKTAEEVARRAKADRIASKHLGIKSASKAKIPSRGFDKTRRKKFSGQVEVIG